MSNVVKIAFMGILALFMFSGCGSNSPEDVAVGFYEAIKNGDVDKYKKYSTTSTQGVMAFGFGMKCMGKNLEDDKELSECMKETSGFSKIESIGTEEKSDTVSIVTLKIYDEDGGSKEEKVKVKKIDDEWKVDISK